MAKRLCEELNGNVYNAKDRTARHTFAKKLYSNGRSSATSCHHRRSWHLPINQPQHLIVN